MATQRQEEELIDRIQRSLDEGRAFDTPLETDERVLARITDGIYRQPSSALRELIANAYDADATAVSITSDAPRFGTIKVSDNGHGMDAASLANLVLHIGGSAKRTQKGEALGVTGKDVTRSPGGRRLIGKIGIGLFSVAQLSRQFTIVTKTAGMNYQLVANVTLNRFDESELAKVDKNEKRPFQAGKVQISAQRTPDKKGHGTTIHLTAILPRVIAILQSQDVWQAIRDAEQNKQRLTRIKPLYHIGELDPNDRSLLSTEPAFPWEEPENEEGRFAALVDAVSTAYQSNNLYARLAHCLDNYFQMLWTLALALPIPYVGEHPYGLNGTEVKYFYKLPDKRGPSAEEITVGPRQNLRARFHLPPPEDSVDDFKVIIDRVKLSRPIQFKDLPVSSQALQGPVIFAGHAAPNMSAIPEDQRGGSLSFSGYFFWTPRVIPTEHNGVLIRINGASGTLFDPTFLKYHVAETRLKQLVAEVYVHEGLDAALNIDRESFNTAHPHYQILANWVHNSIRVVRNVLKDLQSQALDTRRQKEKRSAKRELIRLTDELIESGTDVNSEDVPDVVLVNEEAERRKAAKEGKLSLFVSDVEVVPALQESQRQEWVVNHAIAVGRLLEAHGLLDSLDSQEQAHLVGSILALFAANKDK